MDGVFLFNKPILWTSHDAVDFFRRRLGTRKVGHAGTLDPMATGLLIILAGAATKKSAEFMGLDKDYRGVMTFGLATDSQDFEGRILSESATTGLSAEKIREAFAAFEGDISQTPPSFSSVKSKGRKLYEWARKGVAVEVEPRAVTVKKFELLDFHEPDAHFSLSCSKGTYVRALCDEAGRKLGCGAALSALERTRVGHFHLKDALDQEKVSSFSLERLSLAQR